MIAHLLLAWLVASPPSAVLVGTAMRRAASQQTVATRLDEAGWSARQIADQLGHARPSMTLDTYLGRSVVGSEAARILDR